MWKRNIYGPQLGPAVTTLVSGGGFMWKKVFTGHRLDSRRGHRLVQHASFTALPPGVSEDVMACAHFGGQPNLHLILPCIQELGVVPFLRF